MVTSSPRGEYRRETEGAGALFALDARRPEGSLTTNLKNQSVGVNACIVP